MGDASFSEKSTPLGSTEQAPPEYDVVIVGSGISGINSAHRIQTLCPGATYTILEARNDLGGTWSFFKYPGLRSDSDLHTFGFAWAPWREEKTIADGHQILSYLKECTAKTGIDKKIRYNHTVKSANWDSSETKWTLNVNTGGKNVNIKSRFIILGTGYYDYDTPMTAPIPGLDNFKGKVVHPQFWPEDLDYSGKRIAIVGSGATAITIFPVMAKTAKHVTMVQRSPSYILPLPSRDAISKVRHAILPTKWALFFDRWQHLLLGYGFFYFCRAFPNVARRLLARITTLMKPDHIPLDPHFVPAYNPWEQRLCMCPDGDFYKAMRKGNCDIVTGHIKTVTDRGIIMQSGESVDADVLVTATGLKIHLAGGMKFSVDGKEINPSSKFLWKGVMIQDLPNVFFVIGYTNASWTLGAEATAQMFCRLLNYMKTNGYVAAAPRLENPEKMPSEPMLNLNSTYIKVAQDIMPRTGAVGQWRPRTNYFSDMKEAKKGDILTDLQFYREGLPGEFKKKSQ